MNYKFLGYGATGIALLIIGTKVSNIMKVEGIIVMIIGLCALCNVIYTAHKQDIERAQLIKMNRNLSNDIQELSKKLRKYEK